MNMKFTPFACAAALMILGCSSSNQSPFISQCPTMEANLKEKKSLDAKIKVLTAQVRDYRKQGDTASEHSAEHRLEGMLENQRLLKESLDRSSAECSPILQDQEPVRDPARRENAPK